MMTALIIITSLSLLVNIPMGIYFAYVVKKLLQERK